MKYKLIQLLSFTTLILAGCGFSLAGDVTPPPGYTPPVSVALEATSSVFPIIPADPERGKTIYLQECAGCHGVTGRGDGNQSGNLPKPPQILSDPKVIANTSPAQLFSLITEGVTENNMPAFNTVLDDRARWDVTSYLFLMGSDDADLSAGKVIYDSICASCHGLLGKGDGESARGLPLQPPDFTNQRILSPRTNQELFQIVTSGSANVMPSFEKSLTSDERQQVVQYIRTLSFAKVVIPTVTPELLTQNPTDEAQGNTAQAGTEAPQSQVPVTPGQVHISGKVVQDSGGSLPSDLEVTLHIFDQMAETSTVNTKMTPDGSFDFGRVEMKDGRIFIASVTYDGRVFNSQPSFHPGLVQEGEDFIQPETVTLDVHVSDSTTDTSSLSADRMHLFIDFPQPGMMQIVTLFLISNNGNEVVVPAKDGTGGLRFLLPEGATNLQFDDSTLGERYMPIENGFFDTVAIQPGKSTHQVLFAYDLPYEKKATIKVPITINTSSVSVMIPVGGVTLKSGQLVDGGVRSSQQMSFQVYNGSDFGANSNLTLILTGSPKSTANPQKLTINPTLFGSGVLILVITGILYYYFWRKDKSAMQISGSDDSRDKEAVMDAILSLDEQYKSGKLNEQAYQQRRSELKEQLRKLM